MAAKGKPVVWWYPIVLPPCEHVVLCEVGLSSYGVHHPSKRDAKLVDGRSIVQAPGQVTKAPYCLLHTIWI
jgi:hypothetical protein